MPCTLSFSPEKLDRDLVSFSPEKLEPGPKAPLTKSATGGGLMPRQESMIARTSEKQRRLALDQTLANTGIIRLRDFGPIARPCWLAP